MKLNDILLEQAYALADTEIPQFNQTEIGEAIMAKKPFVELKNVLPRNIYPKVVRWLKEKLKDIKAPKGSENEIGGELKGKLDKFLEKDTIHYESNVRALVRELMRAYEEWEEKLTKPEDLPDVEI